MDKAKRDELRTIIVKRMRPLAHKHNEWGDWPGTWLFADVALSALEEAGALRGLESTCQPAPSMHGMVLQGSSLRPAELPILIRHDPADAIPPDQAQFWQDGKLVGAITDIGMVQHGGEQSCPSCGKPIGSCGLCHL